MLSHTRNKLTLGFAMLLICVVGSPPPVGAYFYHQLAPLRFDLTDVIGVAVDDSDTHLYKIYANGTLSEFYFEEGMRVHAMDLVNGDRLFLNRRNRSWRDSQNA